MRTQFVAALTVVAACAIDGVDGNTDDPSNPDAFSASAITRKGHISSSTASGSHSISFTAPTQPAIGDYLVAQAVVTGGSSVTPPAGWTLIAHATSGNVFQAIYGNRVTSSSDVGSGTWTAAATSLSFTVTIQGFAGVNATTPFRTPPAPAAGSDAISYQAPSLSGLATSDTALVFVATDGGPRPWADSGALFGVIPSGSIPGKLVHQNSLNSFETFSGRQMAFGHSWLSWNTLDSMEDSGSDFRAGSTGIGPNSDYVQGRLSTTSWPSESTWPDGGKAGNGDPATTLGHIASGQYDTVLFDNAMQMRGFKQPLYFRLFCEMNGGDHPWEAGHQNKIDTDATVRQRYITSFNAAWRRIWCITKGTPTSPGCGGVTKFAHADNVLFHWNAQVFQTTTVRLDQLWPGDAYVDFSGVEAYLSSQSGTFDALMTDTNDGGHTHPAFYATFGPSGSLNQARNGLVGNGEAGNRSLGAAGISSYISSTNGLPHYSAWKFFTWWNGGTSVIENESASEQSAFKSFVNNGYMKPTLTTSFDVPSAFAAAYQYRYDTTHAPGTNAAGVRYGAHQSGSMLIVTAPGATSLAGPLVRGYGFADGSAISIALVQ